MSPTSRSRVSPPLSSIACKNGKNSIFIPSQSNLDLPVDQSSGPDIGWRKRFENQIQDQRVAQRFDTHGDLSWGDLNVNKCSENVNINLNMYVLK